MTKTNVRSAAEVEEALEAEKAHAEELLVGMTIDILNSLLANAGISQRQLAERLELTPGRISQVLSGSENLSLRKLADLGWALGVRFEVVPKAIERANSPAEEDPAAPEWIEALRRRTVNADG